MNLSREEERVRLGIEEKIGQSQGAPEKAYRNKGDKNEQIVMAMEISAIVI